MTLRHLQTDRFGESVKNSFYEFVHHSAFDQQVIYPFKTAVCLCAALWQEPMETPALKTCKVEEDLRPWPGKTLQMIFFPRLKNKRCV